VPYRAFGVPRQGQLDQLNLGGDFRRAVGFATDELWARGADEETLAALHDLLEETADGRELDGVPVQST
jgi:hypothetical protein